MRKAIAQFFAFLLVALSSLGSLGQPVCSFEQFSVEDGLPHNTINTIVQDRKGFIWLATLDGLCKYDGYTFHQYKPGHTSDVLMKSNRIDRIIEDKYGRIWMDAYPSKAYCFDPVTETFWGTELLPDTSISGFSLSRIVTNASGLVWLLSDKNGCICISDTQFTAKVYNRSQNNLDATTVYFVYEDELQNSWLLTNSGLVQIPQNHNEQQKSFFSSKTGEGKSFFSAIEFDDEIWFGGSNGTIAKYSKGGKSFRTQKLVIDANIIQFEKINGQTLLAITDEQGFCTINIHTGVTKNFNSTTHPGIKVKNVVPIAFTKGHQLWYVSNYEREISLFDFLNETAMTFPSQSQKIPTAPANAKAYVLTDNLGQVWVQPYGGGFSLFNETDNQLIPFTCNAFAPNRQFSNIFHAAFFDQQGNLWYNELPAGLVKATFSKNNFKTLKLSDNDHYSLTKDVRAIFQTKNGDVWVSSKENQIIILDRNLNNIGTLSPSGKLQQNAVWKKPTYSITQDNAGHIWLGTRGDGAYRLTPKDDSHTYSIEHFEAEESNPYSLSNNDIYSIFQDKANRIWIGTFGGGMNLVQYEGDGTISFLNYRNEWKNYPMNNCNRVRCITENSYGEIYAGTTGGLLVFDPNGIIDGKFNFQLYEKTHAQKNGLNSNDIIDICLTQQDELFIATAGGGISKVISTGLPDKPVQFKTYLREDGLPSNYILSLLEDHDGKIWIGSNNLLTRFDPLNDFFEIFSDVKWALSENIFSEATKYRLSSGEILFGYSEGVLHFFPDQIKTNTYSPYLALTNFQLFNKKVAIGENSPLTLAIDNCSDLTLTHKQNFFNIEYATLDFENPSNIKYAYKLEQFDEDWNYVQKQRTATYTNVPKGEYVFRVKSTNSEGVWADNERLLTIVVKPSFWETPWAYVLYFLVFAASIILIDYNLLTIYRLKSDVKIEKKMSAMKQKFFIDISHEIRTPLTMISAPIEYLINDNRTPETVKKQLSYVAQSSTRILRLVNQILDFRKMQELKMRVSEINVAQFVKDIFNDFTEIAKEQEIAFTFQNDAADAKIWADRNSLEKIIMNLLSNAFKYTPQGKSICVRITKNEKQVSVYVIDEGVGIPKEKQNKLFTRFVSFNSNSSNPSTGIGLSLVKELAEKHMAKVTVESELGKGSTFSVHFQLEKKHFGDDVEFIDEETANKQQLGETENMNNSQERGNDKSKIKVLVIEDDPDLRPFMATILEKDYRVLLAEDGEEGFQKAIGQNPDFIVSDIMMPKMDGIELLKKLRANVQTSHIPIILLTAKTNIESKLEGLTYGADDYITKPFSVPYFKTRIENLLTQRKRLQEIFGAVEQIGTGEFNPKPFLITSQDEVIMEKALESIEKNMDNSEFTVESLAAAAGINRTTMFYKVKSLTGFSPVEFILDIRMKRAAQLISDSQLLIKEVSYMTGFSDLKYFGKCFKRKYGMTPMEYRKYKK